MVNKADETPSPVYSIHAENVYLLYPNSVNQNLNLLGKVTIPHNFNMKSYPNADSVHNKITKLQNPFRKSIEQDQSQRRNISPINDDDDKMKVTNQNADKGDTEGLMRYRSLDDTTNVSGTIVVLNQDLVELNQNQMGGVLTR